MVCLKQIEANICSANLALQEEFDPILSINYDLDRKLVSYQADKTGRVTRWCKYREGFSTDLIRYIFKHLSVDEGSVLDPFAGSGTTLFTANECGLDSAGIELLPNAVEMMDVRNSLRYLDRGDVSLTIRSFIGSQIWEKPGPANRFKHLTITEGAFSSETETQLGRYLYEVARVEDQEARRLLSFAAMCVLEDVSYTRKDGQYLRWDSRAPRRIVSKSGFRKSRISAFTEAITSKCDQISDDICAIGAMEPKGSKKDSSRKVDIMRGSALEILPRIESQSFDAVITSPPYCNRYDYTRTYALELAMMGVDKDELKLLRQRMLSCTVENKEKTELTGIGGDTYQMAVRAFESQELLQSILSYLDVCLAKKRLNNSGIPRMVRNYFKEMALIISECSRVLKQGAPLVMVNDNVRYEGIHIPVDLILSDIARTIGLATEHIWVLPKGKGSSSQQSSLHGRQEIRKCVYVWRKID